MLSMFLLCLLSSGLNMEISGSNKLAPCFVWPLQVFARIAEVTYKLDLPKANLHPQ